MIAHDQHPELPEIGRGQHGLERAVQVPETAHGALPVLRVPRAVGLEVFEQGEVVLHRLGGDDPSRLLRRPQRHVVPALPHPPVGEVVRHRALLHQILPGAESRARRERGERRRGESPLRVRHLEVLGSKRVQEGGAPPAFPDLPHHRALEEDPAQGRSGEPGEMMSHGGRSVHAGEDRRLAGRALRQPRHAERGVDPVRLARGAHARVRHPRFRERQGGKGAGRQGISFRIVRADPDPVDEEEKDAPRCRHYGVRGL